MEFPLNRYYGFNRFFLSLIGLWPYQSAPNVWICRIFILLMTMFTAVAQIIKICTTELTADFVFDVLPFVILNIGVILEFMLYIASINRMRDLLERIKANWERTESPDEIKIMHTHAATARIISKIFLLYGISGVNIYIFITILPQILDVLQPLNESRSRVHPFQFELFIDEEEHFYLTRFLIYFMILVMIVIFLANIAMFVVYMQHASGMFAILGHRAESLFNGDILKARSICKTVKDYRSIVLFVEDHRSALEFIDAIQFTYNFILFLEIIPLVMLIGLTLLQIIKFSRTVDQSFRAIVLTGGQLLYLYIYSYMGQKLIDTSAQIPIKIYLSEWYIMPVWKQKIMFFIMMRSMRTVCISLYNICTVSLESFSMFTQSAISFCTVLSRI